jgi:arylsulfatase A-like enzyme
MLSGAPLVAEVERLLDGFGGRTPFFVWVHFMDPHGPYFPPQEYRDRFPVDDYRRPDDPAILPIGGTNFGLGIVPAYQVVQGESSPAVYRARYDAEVRYVDDHVGAVVRALERRGLSDRTLVVLTADHGESLGEHGYYFAHGWYVYDDTLRVPLLLRGPGVPAGRRVKQSVSLVDLAPTVLDLLALPPSPAMEGTSLRSFLAGQATHREAFAQTYYGEGLAAYRSGTIKYVFKPSRAAGARPASDPPFPDATQEWLYDLAADPGETRSLVDEQPAVAATMRLRLQEWLGEQQKRGRGHVAEQPRQGSAPMRVLGDPQVERQLRALGYLD